ncbi:MAG: KamA family radical SAM protein [Proteobacteria bacterium]|nr:KamA family radical SAM protein [Pseudomonadota bacterium]
MLWDADPKLHGILKEHDDLETLRDAVYAHLEKCERAIFAIENDLHILEKATVRECIRVFRSLIGPINEYRTETSALDCLWKLARERKDELTHEVSVGFIMEFIRLFQGIAGNSNLYRENEGVRRGIPEFLKMKGRQAAEKRTETLDEIAAALNKHFMKYPSGLRDEVVEWRKANRRRILNHFGASEEDWKNWEWQVEHVIKDPSVLFDLIELTKEQQDAVNEAARSGIPFGVTPYYLSLMDRTLSIGYDHAVRAQVIPPPDYVKRMAVHKSDRSMMFDFMGEHDTSPVDLVTRRYPMIAIMKPFNTCSQICVYCQRNWEIEECLAPDAMAAEETIDEAMKWLDKHRGVGDVLITGGDPAVMPDEAIEHLLAALAKKSHVYRIRIGTRTPVVLPSRWTKSLTDILQRYHEPGRREIAVVTHFVHPYEVTPEAMEAVQRIAKCGIRVYNQEVFTVENSRRFESAKLRKVLKSIGIDPYYTFNMKGKEETRRYMVPIARILQERKEEARLLPGLDRTDEPVFNVPKLGKNHLRAMQDHRLVMIRPDGARVYEFHPWEKNIAPVPPYNYIDVPIYDYLEELAARGENIREYRTIWYYY